MEGGLSTSISKNVPGFHWVDFVLFGATLVVSMAIGLFQAFTGGRQKTTKEYLMANRSLQTFPVAVSMCMSFVSAIMILGNTAEMYTRGTQFYLSSFGTALGYLLSAQIFVPLFFPLKLTSSFEYIDKRFGSRVLRLTSVFIMVLSQILYMGLAMFAPATALKGVSEIPEWASILACGAVATLYTTVGGMKAVVWTDFFQGMVLITGLITVLIVGSIRVGGMDKIWSISYREGRINFFDFNPDPFVRMNFWVVIMGRAARTMVMSGTNQTMIQRFCALPTQREAKRAVYWNIPFGIVLSTIICLSGLVIFAFYADAQCDPIRAGWISSNQVLPRFILEVANSPGLPGLFLAVLFSGALSTISSSLSSLSAVTWQDILQARFHHLPESRKALITKILVFGFGCFAVGFAFLAGILRGHVTQAAQSLVGGVGAPLSGIFVLGAVFPWSNWKGATVGAVVSLAVGLWINIGAYAYGVHRQTLNTTIANCSFEGNATAPPLPDTDDSHVFILYKMSFMLVPMFGLIVCILVGLIVSFITGPTKIEDIDPQLLSPFFNRMCCCLPASLLRKCWCGVDFEKVVDGDREDEAEYKNTHRLSIISDRFVGNTPTPKRSQSFGNEQNHDNQGFEGDQEENVTRIVSNQKKEVNGALVADTGSGAPSVIKHSGTIYPDSL